MRFVDGPVAASVPASSANLGPGFDTLGLAVGVLDGLGAEVVDGPLQILVEGEGAEDVPRDERHLVHRAMVAAFTEMVCEAPGLRLVCSNLIPHARGLGSSSAAIVGGIVLARALVEDGRSLLDEEAALALATRLEGHPDNVAPALLGGLTVSVTQDDGRIRVARLQPDPEIAGVVYVPPDPLSTEVARGLLPDVVPHADAAANAGRAALLVTALTGRADLLLPATEDRLHQQQRRPAMPDSMALVDALRADGVAAVVSGAGPSVLALVRDRDVEEAAARLPAGWTLRTPDIGVPGASVEVG
ncbi:homoserine kinase [Marmoricola endophyticus]|uniref:Homoserine kinase n=1 Tax=Marmoricola endophyticus TaxID=2040280 RepID=A0A917F1I1_9ACTN|nr:homoserine kinase [Marmoricola endophyticus]GGF41043.1 homoserine kinase [Marmoricola endophyticus]